MKPIEVIGSANKAALYPVDNSATVNNSSNPDSHIDDLVTAVQYGVYDRVVELIDADPQLAVTPLNDNITLLHWAAINNRIEIAKYLINKGANIDAVGGSLNSTPLHWAVRDGKLEMIIFLLSYNAQPSLVDIQGYSCIHLASMFGYTAIVAYLIAKGQDADLPDQSGVTPLMHAAHRIVNRDPTQLLIRLGASVNYQNPNTKNTALHHAILGNNAEAVRALVDGGAKTSIRNADNEDAYDLAAKSNSSRHLIFLLAKITFTNKDLPKLLQIDRSYRRLGTKIVPYIILICVAFILEFNLWFVYKGVLLLAMCILTYGHMMIFFDENVDRYLPIAVAQASIFWLVACYLYYFLPYVHIISFGFIAFVICTYLSMSNYHLAQKCDPGYITANHDQQNRIIIQLVEQNSFDSETYCTWCLVRKPLRSKHCRECRKCVAKFDHHCPWIDNCVGDKNLRYFTGFVCFTPISLGLFLHGAYLYFRSYCHVFPPEAITNNLTQVFTCSPSIVWFTSIALLHTFWISGLGITILFQVAAGFTTNERMNFWRYKYLQASSRSPFSFGWIQNLVDLVNRRILWYIPTNLDWTRIYTLDDFTELIPLRLRRLTSSSSNLSNV